MLWWKPEKTEQNRHLWFPQNNSGARETWQKTVLSQFSIWDNTSKLKINASDRDSMKSGKVEIPHDVIPASSKHCGSRREVSPGRGRRHQVAREGELGEGGRAGREGGIKAAYLDSTFYLFTFFSFQTNRYRWNPNLSPIIEYLLVKEREKEGCKLRR